MRNDSLKHFLVLTANQHTGGANGVGEALVRALYVAGAHVVFGDTDVSGSEKLINALTDIKPSTVGTVDFLKTDVTVYQDNVSLFQQAFAKHGCVDHALSIAGVTEGQNWFDPSLNLESVRLAPSTAVVDINLIGALYFARVAAVYLREGNTAGRDKSLLLTGSLASFKAQAGLYIYQAAKHGVLGLFRSTRKSLHQLHGIRVNILMPGLIDTGMSSRILHIWKNARLPVNTAEEVASFALSLTRTKQLSCDSPSSGLAVYVEGGKGWELESDLDRLDSQWMGEEMAENCAKINEALGIGSGWTTDLSKI